MQNIFDSKWEFYSQTIRTITYTKIVNLSTIHRKNNCMGSHRRANFYKLITPEMFLKKWQKKIHTTTLKLLNQIH